MNAWPDGEPLSRREEILLGSGAKIATKNFYDGIAKGFVWGMAAGVVASLLVRWIFGS